MSEKNRLARLEWCKKYQHKPMQFWERMVFTDESPFSILFQQREYAWIPKNERPLITPTKKFSPKINVWGGFCSTGTTKLVRIVGNMDQHQFKAILVQNFITFYRRKFRKRSNKGYLQMDNDSKHKSKLVQRYLSDEKVKVLDWPSQSPDLNPIENVWSELDRRTSRVGINNTDELFEALCVAWHQLPLKYLKNLARSMPNRIKAVIKNNGLPINY